MNPRRRSSRPATVVSGALGAGLLAALALGACSGAGSAGSSNAGSAPSKAVAPAAPGAAGSSGSAGGSGSGGVAADAESGSAAAPGTSVGAKAGTTASPANPGSPVNPGTAADLATADKLVRTASMQVQVEDVESGAADVRRLTVAAGGMVVSENSSAVPSGTAKGAVDKDGSRSVLSLAVPSDALDRVLDDVGKLGTTVNRSSSSRDVTSTYVDTQSRLTTMRAGLDQLRALLAKTTGLDQVVTLETEISRRQADLDAMQAQLNALDKKVAMSTLTVTLVTAAQVVVPEEDGTGFLGGLRHGWAAFLTTFGGILTVLGVVLPFAALLALLGLPAFVWWRRHRSAAAAEPARTAPPATTARAIEETREPEGGSANAIEEEKEPASAS